MLSTAQAIKHSTLSVLTGNKKLGWLFTQKNTTPLLSKAVSAPAGEFEWHVKMSHVAFDAHSFW